MADKPGQKNGTATTAPGPRPVPDVEPTLGEQVEPRTIEVPADLPVIDRNAVTNAIAGSIMALGEEGAGVGDLVTVGATDSVMQLLLDLGLTTPELATPKVGYFRDLRGRVAR